MTTSSTTPMPMLMMTLLSLLAACATTSQPADEPGTTTYVLRHQPAAEIAEILTDVLQSRGTVPDEPMQTSTDRPARIEMRLRVRADPSRNALLMHGSATQVHEALELARRLDVPEITIPAAR